MDRAEALKFAVEVRDKLSYRLECALKVPARSYYEKLCDTLTYAIAALREQEQSKWISVKEKPMPEGNEEYEVCCDYRGKKRIEIHKGWNTHGVTHWRPLPEPPKEGAEG